MTNYSIEIGNEQLPIIIRKRRGTRRFILRYQPLSHAVSLTLPPYASVRQALRFADEKCLWLERQIKRTPPTVPFSDGQVIPMLGGNYTLRHVGGRGVIRVAAQPDDGLRITDDKKINSSSGTILVPGNPEFMARRVREWLKLRAKEEIVALAQHKAAQLGVRLKKISLRDTSSRWGSCSHDGNLSFSWRLILAPSEVLEYLVSHEVAHMREHNHSAAFWALVAALFPPYKQAQQWLKAYGPGLYAYGQ